uniref:Cytochrome c oxidase subunit n=1 Tax=Ursus americanus TaxID=9643 RepID=A0A452SWI4_URSAM
DVSPPQLGDLLTGTHGERGSACRWEVLSPSIKLPLVGVSVRNTFLKFQRRRAGETQVHYSYLHIKPKPFPWEDGNHTLFQNPCVNRLPTGFEDD